MAHVQTITKESTSGGTPQTTLVFDSTAFTAGNALVLRLKWESAVTITSVVDSGGVNTWTDKAARIWTGDVQPTCQIYLVGNITGFTGTVTVTFSGAGATWIHGWVSEYDGIAALSNPSDQYITNDGTQSAGPTNPPASGNVTTTEANEVCCAVIGGFTSETYSNLAINGVAATTRGTLSDSVAFDTFPSSTFTGQATANMSADDRWVIALITLKTSGGGGTIVRSIVSMRVPSI